MPGIVKDIHAQIQEALKTRTSQMLGSSGNSAPISNSVSSIILGRNMLRTTVMTRTNIKSQLVLISSVVLCVGLCLYKRIDKHGED